MKKKTNIKLSIIIPVYNGERNLKRCLDSLRNQTEDHFQIIIIDDGSTDGSSKIIEKFSTNFPYIKVFKTENQGVSAARNLGIEKADGEYLTFLDCDDWLEEDAVKNYLSDLENKDLIIYNYYSESLGLKSTSNKVVNLSQEESLSLLLEESVKGYVWNKVYKKQVIKENNLSFDNNYKFCEDLNFNVKFILKCNKISYINQRYYHYEDNVTSITAQKFSDKKITALDALTESISLLKSSKNREEYITHYYHILISLLVYGKEENKLDKNLEMSLRKHLWDYSLPLFSMDKISISVVLFRFFPSLSYKAWKKIKK